MTRLSVIVPVHRQWDLVPDLLAALAAQTLDPAAFETILVNNDAPPRRRWPSRGIRSVDAAAPGAYAARNEGAAAARGGWLVFTDADCRPEPGWLAALAAAIDAATPPRAPLPLLAGPVRMLPPAAPSRLAQPTISSAASRRRATSPAAMPPPPISRCRPRSSPPSAASTPPAAPAATPISAAAPARAGHPLRLVGTAVVAHPCRADWAALATKARRIKGGQIRAGPLPRRLAWTLRTLLPPVADTRAYLASAHPLGQRLTAVAVRFRLWGVELAETARLLAGRPPERR